MKKSGRLGWLVSALVLLTFCGGCSFLPRFNKKLSGDRAFIRYSPSDANSNQLRLAVKDNIDVKDVVTTTGSEFFLKSHKPASADAPCLEIARQRGVKIVGKTNMTEFAVAPSGVNDYFGTPVNPLDRDLIPGGSSSGNAVALANGEADVAFGTDTAGSIRVPAACCGIVGLKTTQGLVSVEGVTRSSPNISIPSARWAKTSRRCWEWNFSRKALPRRTLRQRRRSRMAAVFALAVSD